jgi:hypothetical protein
MVFFIFSFYRVIWSHDIIHGFRGLSRVGLCLFFSFNYCFFLLYPFVCLIFFKKNHLSIFDLLIIEWFFHIWCFRSTVDINFFLLLIFFHLIIWHYFLSWVSWFSLISFLLDYLNLITWPISLVGWPEQTCVFFFVYDCYFFIVLFYWLFFFNFIIQLLISWKLSLMFFSHLLFFVKWLGSRA